MADPKIKYDIGANVTGDADVARLVAELEGLAKTLDGDVKNSALQSAQALRQLGDRQGAIENFVKVKTAAEEAGQRLADLTGQAQKMGRELSALDNPTRAQSGQMQKLRDAVRAAKQEVVDNTTAVQRARAGLQAFGLDTANLAQKEREIQAAIGQARAQIEQMGPAYQRAAAAATAAGNAQQRAGSQAAEGVSHLAEQVRTLESIQRTLQATLAGAGLGVGLQQIREAADSYANLQARVRLVTGEGENFARAWQGVTEVAQRTNTDLETTGTLFTRIAQAGKDAGQSAQQASTNALALTETINQALAVSGGSAESSQAAITQLIQALQSGVLRGEEFNSVMEQAPRLARALADGLGVTTGELRKMSQAGTLTASTVIKAIQSQSATLRSEFEQMPPTIGRALQGLSNAWTLYIGEADKASGVSHTAAAALGVLSQNIGSVVGFLADLGKATAALKLLDLASTLNAKAAAAAASARAIETDATATERSTAATRINTLELERNAVARGAAAAASTAHAAAEERAAVASVSVGQRFAQVGAAATGALARLASFAAGVGAAWLAIEVGSDVLKKTGTALGEGIARLVGFKDRTKELEEAERSWQAQAQAGAEIRARQNDLNQVAIEKSFELTKATRAVIAEFDGLIVKGDSASEAIGKIGKNFDLASVPGIQNAGAVLDKLAADGKISADQFRKAWGDALKDADLGVFETNARAAFAGSAREAERMAAVLDATAREAIRRTGLDFDLISGGMGKASRSAINDTEAIIANLDRLKEQGADVGRVLVASIGKSIQSADSTKALDAVRAQIEQLRKTLGDKIADGLLDQVRTKILDLKDASDQATPGINSLREAFKQLGLQAPEDLQRIADKNRQAWEVIRREGGIGSEELKRAFQAYADSAIAASGSVGTAQRAVTEAALQTEAAGKGLQVAFDDAGHAIVKGAFEGADALDKLTNSTQGAADAQRDLNKARKEGEAVSKPDTNARDTQGNIVNMGAPTLMSIVAQLKGYGLADDKAQQLAHQFTNPQGEVPYFNNPGQKKYGQQYDTLEMAVQRAAEKVLYMNGGAPADSQAKAATGDVKTINVNIGGTKGQFQVASQADADSAIAVFRALEQEANRTAL